MERLLYLLYFAVLSFSVLHRNINYVFLALDRLGNDLGIAGITIRCVGHLGISGFGRLGVRLIFLREDRPSREGRNLLKNLTAYSIDTARLDEENQSIPDSPSK